MRFNEYELVIKSSDELTENEKNQNMLISIAEYPPYEKYYRQNKYYSVIKPQMVGMVFLGEELIGTGKFLWQDVQVGHKTMKLFGFGVLINSKHHGKGLGTKYTELCLEKAKSLQADLVYATTDNPIMDHVLQKLGFRQLSVPVDYDHALSGECEREDKHSYIFEVKEGVFDEIESSGVFYLGQGPI